MGRREGSRSSHNKRRSSGRSSSREGPVQHKSTISEAEERERIKENILKIFRAKLKSPNQGGALLVGPDKNPAQKPAEKQASKPSPVEERSHKTRNKTRSHSKRLPKHDGTDSSSQGDSGSRDNGSMTGRGKSRKSNTVRKQSKRKKSDATVPVEKDTAFKKHMKIAHAVTYPHGRGNTKDGGTITGARITQQVGLINTGKKGAPATRVALPAHVSRRADMEVRKLVHDVHLDMADIDQRSNSYVQTPGSGSVGVRSTHTPVSANLRPQQRSTGEKPTAGQMGHNVDTFPVDLPVKEVVIELLQSLKIAVKTFYPDRDYLRETKKELLSKLKESSQRDVTPSRLPVFHNITRSAQKSRRQSHEEYPSSLHQSYRDKHESTRSTCNSNGYVFSQNEPKIQFININPFQALNGDRNSTLEVKEVNNRGVDPFGGKGDAERGHIVLKDDRLHHWLNEQGDALLTGEYFVQNNGDTAQCLQQSYGEQRPNANPMEVFYVEQTGNERSSLTMLQCPNGSTGESHVGYSSGKGLRDRNVHENHRNKILGEISAYMKNLDHSNPGSGQRSSIGSYLLKSGPVRNDRGLEMSEGHFDMGRCRSNADINIAKRSYDGRENRIPVDQNSQYEGSNKPGLPLRQPRGSDHSENEGHNIMDGINQFFLPSSNGTLGNSVPRQTMSSPQARRRASPDSPIMTVEDMLRQNQAHAARGQNVGPQTMLDGEVGVHRGGGGTAGQQQNHLELHRGEVRRHVQDIREQRSSGDGIDADMKGGDDAINLLARNEQMMAVQVQEQDMLNVQSRTNSQYSQCSSKSTGVNIDIIQNMKYMPSFHSNYYTDHIATSDLSWQQRPNNNQACSDAMDILDYIDQHSNSTAAPMDYQSDPIGVPSYPRGHPLHSLGPHNRHSPLAMSASPGREGTAAHGLNWLPGESVNGLRSLIPPPPPAWNTLDTRKMYPRTMF